MKMNKYKCKCSDSVCKLESNKRPTFCHYYSHVAPDWRLVVDEVPNLGNADTPIPNLGTPWDKLPLWIKDGIKNELRWAIDKHPKFPDDPFQAMCIIHKNLEKQLKH